MSGPNYCTSCGNELDEKWLHCPNCGSALRKQNAENKLTSAGQKLQESGDKMMKVGTKMNQVGSVLTWLFTLPFLGLIFFGIPGLLVGVVIGLLGAAGSISRMQTGAGDKK